MTVLAQILLIILTLIILSCNITFFIVGDYKYYRKGYKSFKNSKITQNPEHPYYQALFDDSSIWWSKKNSFRINTNSYIHNMFYDYLCPYTLYWLIKYKKLMKTRFPKLYNN